MRISFSWLKEYLTLDLSPEELAETLTLAGLEVDKIEQTPLPFSGVVVAEVQETQPHPNANKLQVATVFDGTNTLQIVCGDPNCRAGVKTALATVGGFLTDEKGEKWKIKKAKLRDVESFGMLCTEKELGLSNDHSTIMHFPEEIQAGTDLATLYSDTIFDISLTPNLGHCMSMIGIAREVGALLGIEVQKPSAQFTPPANPSSHIEIAIETPSGCDHYSACIIKNVKVAPSPAWMAKRLEASGIRPINNVVDVTNYCMLAMGQPLHAYDYEKIQGKTIKVKAAETEVALETLDEQKRKVPSGTLLICDESKPLGVAGVIGGKSSEVSDRTTHILLEAAHFDPQIVRKASKKLQLRTESSARFERGVDRGNVTHVLSLAAKLIQECAGGELNSPLLEKELRPVRKRTINCRLSRVNQILGTKLSLSEVETYFHRLNMDVKVAKDETLHVAIPSFRNDIVEEIDLIEEAARMYGYNNIRREKPSVKVSALPHTPLFLTERAIREKLIAEGLQEFLTCDLISPELAELSIDFQESIPVLHPSSVDQSILRTSLLPGLLQSIKHNADHRNPNIAAFELGRIHFKSDGKYKERSAVAILLTGDATPHFWGGKSDPVSFYDLKGILENLLESFQSKEVTWASSDLKCFHPGAQATIECESMRVGVIGEVHPTYLKKLGIGSPVFYAELDLHDLEETRKKKLKMTPLPLYPGSDRDWTVTIKSTLSGGKILEAIKTLRSKLLKNVEVIDLYEGEKLPPGEKNITLRFSYRSDKGTVEQAAVEKEHLRITEKVLTEFHEQMKRM